MSIENPTLSAAADLAHFLPSRGSCTAGRHFSSLFTNLPAYKALYLRAYKAPDIYVPIRHYICRESSTNQLLYMQNKPNFQKSQMNVNPYNTTDYERKRDWTLGENKPNSNPIKPNLRKAKMNINSLITKDYENERLCRPQKNKPNQSQFQTRRRFFFLLQKR